MKIIIESMEELDQLLEKFSGKGEQQELLMPSRPVIGDKFLIREGTQVSVKEIDKEGFEARDDWDRVFYFYYTDHDSGIYTYIENREHKWDLVKYLGRSD